MVWLICGRKMVYFSMNIVYIESTKEAHDMGDHDEEDLLLLAALSEVEAAEMVVNGENGSARSVLGDPRADPSTSDRTSDDTSWLQDPLFTWAEPHVNEVDWFLRGNDNLIL